MIAHFTAQLNGGGHIAARRLHEALRRDGVDSQFYHGSGDAGDPSYHALFENRSFFWRNRAALAVSWRSRHDAPGGYILRPTWIRNTPLSAIGNKPKVVQLHDVARWLDLPSFFASLPAGMPVVWYLHTLLPVTGGCIYPGLCEGFMRQCGDCPQIKNSGPRDETRKFFNILKGCYKKINLHLVGNSTWTTEQARRSNLAQHAKSICTIPLGLNVDQFKPVNKAAAREALGIAPDRFVVGFACSSFTEKRKGAHLLIEALKGISDKNTLLAVFGSGLWPKNATPVETLALGSLNSPRLQSLYYSALDVLAMPTQIETFGLVALEAMACATPVVAYPAGGLADLVITGQTGLVEPETGSVPGLIRMLDWMQSHPAERLVMGQSSRQRVVEEFSDSLMARRFTDLYRDLKILP